MEEAAEMKDVKFITPGDRRHVIYECNFAVDAKDAQAFIAYLRNHMAEIVGLDGGLLFDRATLCIAENEGSHGDDGKYHVCVRYRARSRFQLQAYFDRAGERLRQDMIEKWGGRFTVQRRILAVDSVIERGAEEAVRE